MGLRSRMLAGLASQLGRPTGLRGRVIGNMLNRSNRGEIAMAIAALDIPSGAVVADLGFGGGVGVGRAAAAGGGNGRGGRGGSRPTRGGGARGGSGGETVGG